VFNKYAGTLFSTLTGMEPATEPVLPYPHARNDCGLCREMDTDFEIVEEELEPPDWTGREARRFCQGRIGRWMATMAMARPGEVPPGTQLAVTVTLLRSGGGSW
jgi:hypothetical protein